MNRKSLLIVLTSAIIAVSPSTAQKVKFLNAEDSLSYALGVANYEYYKKDSLPINAKMFAKGMTDASKSKAVMNDTSSSAFVVKYMQDRELAKLEKQYASKIEEARKFLGDNSKAEGVVTLPSGLQYKVITKGTGATPGPNDVVRVHYKGTTIDGAKFDSSYDRGEPARFRVSNVIKGWVEGLQLMQEGSKYMLYIPCELAYGERGAGSIIKPFETLIFEVELLEVIKDQTENR